MWPTKASYSTKLVSCVLENAISFVGGTFTPFWDIKPMQPTGGKKFIVPATPPVNCLLVIRPIFASKSSNHRPFVIRPRLAENPRFPVPEAGRRCFRYITKTTSTTSIYHRSGAPSHPFSRPTSPAANSTRCAEATIFHQYAQVKFTPLTNNSV